MSYIENIKNKMYSQLRFFQYLDDDGIFKSVPEYPEFPWFEGIVNAIIHRYSRNPKIARVLSDFGYVRELNEGVKRIYNTL